MSFDPGMIETDVLIVGAGPIGIELAVALKRAAIAYVHVDAGQIGSTIAWYAPQTHFFSSPERIAISGVPLQTLDQSKATREEYLAYLRAVTQQFDLDIRRFERVTAIARDSDDAFQVTTQRRDGERRYRTKNIVLAIGDMHRPRLLGIPGEELPHVSHYFADPHDYFRSKVLVVGGRNSAVEAAIRCVRVGAAVTLAYRGAALDASHIKFWLFPEINAMIRDGRMIFLPSTVVREIHRDRAILTGASGQEIEIDADFVLLLTGYEQDSNLFLQAGVTLEGPWRRPHFDPRTMETDVPGVYVAGTAAAGTQSSGVREFIETSHVHVERIVAALTGSTPPAPAEEVVYEMPES